MHGVLYVEMAGFFMSRIVAGLDYVDANKARPFHCNSLLLVVIRRISSDGLDGRNF